MKFDLKVLWAYLVSFFRKTKPSDVPVQVVPPPVPVVKTPESAPTPNPSPKEPSNPILDAYKGSNPQYDPTSNAGVQPHANYDYSGFDVAGNGLFRRNTLSGGVVYTFTHKGLATGEAHWEVFIDTAVVSSASKITLNGVEQDLAPSNHVVFNAVKGEVSTLTVMVNQTTAIGVDAKYNVPL